ncbi:1720_t:CDS:2 [Acaulospora morrowiae]|uniref:1720_t:CDS:1 n=1 Tax=Acaulospora morrowiae TaxID=94023 RepID=A0A9N8V028_9GLOM|nr:1720_t:CDS:2 [Acaulospora morrowiae]
MRDLQTANSIDEAEHIVLNVGGVKYETYKSTLTAYPDTFLGTMFANHNKPLLRHLGSNEYFIDRNGYIFYYILEFYRTGKINFRESTLFHQHQLRSSTRNGGGMHPPTDRLITREELEEEIHYFQLPISSVWSSLTQRAITTKIDSFVDALHEIFYQVLCEFESSVEIDFRRNKHQPHVKIRGVDDTATIYRTVASLLKPYVSVGYVILDKFGTEIGCHLKYLIPELKWELLHIDNYNWYCVKMTTMEGVDFDYVIQNSCLGQTIEMNSSEDDNSETNVDVEGGVETPE